MSSHKLRTDTTCQNCGRMVEDKFCPNCGQKNTETRQSFAHLFAHFIEDLTHYDTAFWKTIKYMLFRPARLTKEYLAGRRQSYVPPVKLYIFISFLTFFIPAVMPDVVEDEHEEAASKPLQRKIHLHQKEEIWDGEVHFEDGFQIQNRMAYTSVNQMDSAEALKPDSLRLSSFERRLAVKQIALFSHYSTEEVSKKFDDQFLKNIPKAIFVYMPVFAFWLWLFHSKKRWYFFDHAIFTLHYFSFLLLTYTIVIVLILAAEYINDYIMAITGLTTLTFLFIWQVYYFYRSHRKMYNERFSINFLKSTAMFVINFISITLVFIFFMRYTFYTLH